MKLRPSNVQERGQYQRATSKRALCCRSKTTLQVVSHPIEVNRVETSRGVDWRVITAVENVESGPTVQHEVDLTGRRSYEAIGDLDLFNTRPGQVFEGGTDWVGSRSDRGGKEYRSLYR